MDCIMGVALLRRFVVEFDHMTPRLVLHDRAAWRAPDDAETVPLVFRANPNVPYVDIELVLAGGRATAPLRVVPDTGAAFYAAALVGDAAKRVQAELLTVPALTYTDSRVTQLFAARPVAIRVGGGRSRCQSSQWSREALAAAPSPTGTLVPASSGSSQSRSTSTDA
jgi:hypothetical protein